MKITDFSVQNWRFTLVAFLAVLAIGISSLLAMPRAEDPPYRAPSFWVTVVYAGTSAEDMEKLIVKPVEKKLANQDRLKRISTSIRAGVAVFVVDYQYGVSIDDKFQEITREVNALRADLPADITSLEVNKASSSAVSIYQFALTGANVPDETLKKWSEHLKDRLAPLKSLKSVDVWAIPDPELRVTLDPGKLAAEHILLGRVLGALQTNNVNIPGGSVEAGGKKLDVKTRSDFNSVDDIGDSVVNTDRRATVFLRDIAHLEKSSEDETYRARINGVRCAFVTVAMRDGQNIQAVESQVMPLVQGFEKELPPEIQLVTVFNQPSGVGDRLSRFAKDFAIAILLVLVTLLPLGGRASLIVMIAIPLSLAIGLSLLNLLGYTINQLSIVGMIVALGILVDDSIVVVENTERWLRNGATRHNAAVGATKQIATAILGCTILLIFAFLPLIFLPEGSGDFIRSLPMAVVTCVLASLLVALTVVPFLSSRLLSAKHRPEGNIFLRLLDTYVIQKTEGLVARALARPRTTLALAMGLFVLSLGLFPVIGQSLFPKSEKPMFLVNIKMPAGTNLDATDNVALRVERLLIGKPGVASVATSIGHDNPQVYYNVTSQSNAEQIAQLFVQLSNTEARFKEELIEQLRVQTAEIEGAKVEVREFEQGPPVVAPVAYRIFCEDLTVLDAAATKVESVLKSTPGTIYVDNPLAVKPLDMEVVINREKAGLYGVGADQIARAVRFATTGITVGKLRSGGDEDDLPIRVMVSRDNAKNANPTIFENVFVDTASGQAIPLNHLTTVGVDSGFNQIRHYDRKRTVTVGAFIQSGYTVPAVNDAIWKELNAMDLGPGVTIAVSGEKESSNESFSGLGTIILITIFGFIGVLILEFRSFKSLLIVLSIIPLGVIGALIALLLFHETFSFTATIGLIALTGIEIKNSLLFVDFANLLRAQGKDIDDAVKEAGRMRYIPIMLTSLTAICGLIPLIIEYSPLYSPLAMVLVGGIMSSTALTRFVIPAVYKLFAPVIEKEEKTVLSGSPALY